MSAGSGMLGSPEANGSGPGAPGLRPFTPRTSQRWLAEDPTSRYHAVDGSLVFVDISGFTAMSERLARYGRVGAEEVTDLLNQTFTRLLAVAYEDDGALLKFGGDALLLQFDGEDHAARAVNAAWGMRRKLRDLQPLQSSAGKVTLRMSIGVHTGVLDQFLVGSTHRELLLVGHGTSETVRMESAASAGQILLSSAVVASLGDRIATVPLGPGHLLRHPPMAPAVRSQVLADVPDDVPGRLLPEQVRRRLEGGVPRAEHRPAVIGFVKFVGVDAYLAANGPSATATALEAVVDTVVHAAAAHDVCLLASDVDADGGKLILTAGVPSSEEFDGERMLRVLRAIVDADLPLPLKVGTHHGPVFAGVVGPWFRLSYTIIGDAVNLAARVMAHAQPGELLATAEVLNRSQALFQVEELAPFAAKGKKAPVVAYRVGAVTAQRLRRARARFRLAGRHDELQLLVDEVDAVTTGTGRVLHLVGPAGIGKSRLVDELQERRPEVRVAMTACSRYESATPYHAVGTLVRALLGLPAAATAGDLVAAIGQHAPQLAEQAPLLGAAVGIAVDDNETTRDLTAGFRAERVVAAVGALFDAVLGEPTVLVVEDVHWADPESWSVLRALAKTVLPRRRWILLLTSRHPVVLDRELDVPERTCELGPLSAAASRELVLYAVEEGLVSLEQGQRLLERAGGNPFFLEELLRVGGDGDLPDDVDALVQTQLDQLPTEDRQLLADVAVLGAEVDVDLFAAAAEVAPDLVVASLGRLPDFVERTGPRSFRFRHALVHDGAYSRLPFRRRRELHLRAAATLESDPVRCTRSDLIALHTYHARDWERARSYALDAAEQASARFANLTAAEQLRHAIESGRHIPELADGDVSATWERLGDALMLACSYEEAVGAYRNAMRQASPARQVHLSGQIGQLRERQGRYGDALRWYTRAIRLDATVEAGAAPRLLVESAIVRARQGRPRDALRLARQADRHGPDLRTRARVAYVDAWCAMLQGEDGAEAQERTLRLFEEADDLIGQGLAFNIISMAAYYRGDWDEAARAYEQAAMLRRRVGDEVAAAAAAGNLGELLADQGHFQRARGLLEECRTVCAAAGFQSSRHFATMTLGRLDARVGDYEAAEAQIVEGRVAFRAMKMAWLEFDAIRYLAELEVFRGDVEAALAGAEAVDEAAQLGSAGLRSVGQRLRTCALVAAGEVAAARTAALDLLGRLAADARDYDSALSLAAAACALEDAGVPAAADARARSRAALRRLGVVVPAELLLFGPTSARAVVATEEVVTGRVLVPAALAQRGEDGTSV